MKKKITLPYIFVILVSSALIIFSVISIANAGSSSGGSDSSSGGTVSFEGTPYSGTTITGITGSTAYPNAAHGTIGSCGGDCGGFSVGDSTSWSNELGGWVRNDPVASSNSSNSSGSSRGSGPPPPACSITITPPEVTVGDTVTMKWNLQYAASGKLYRNNVLLGTLPKSGTRTIAAGQTPGAFTYEIRLASAQKCSDTLLVKREPRCTIRANPVNYTEGGSTLVTWNSSNNAEWARLRTTMHPDPVEVKLDNSRRFAPGYKAPKTVNYRLTVGNGAGGVASCSVNTHIRAPEETITDGDGDGNNDDEENEGEPCETATCEEDGDGFTGGGNDDGGIDGGGDEGELSIRAIPALVQRGESSRIKWDSSGADACSVAGPNFSATGEEGEETASNIQFQSTYILTCQFDSGPRSVQAIVNVIPSWRER